MGAVYKIAIPLYEEDREFSVILYFTPLNWIHLDEFFNQIKLCLKMHELLQWKLLQTFR